MDYSSIPHDSENLSGPSPWASSPQQNRDSLGPSSDPDLHHDILPPQAPNFQGSTHTRQQSDDSDRAHQTPVESENGDPGRSGLSPQQRESQQEPGQAHRDGEGGSQQQQQGPPKPQSQRYHPVRPGSRQNVPQYKLQAKVMGLERTGRKDPILRFDVYTNLPGFRTTQFRDVRRTHSEFIKLADHLISSSPEAFVPSVPPPQTSAGVGTDEDDARVKHYMQRWLNVVCANDILIRDEEVVRFIEGDPGYSPVVRRSQPATGVRRKVIKQFAPPPDDTPELQEARPIVKMFYLGTMDAGQKVDKVVKVRRALGLAEVDFGAKLAQLSEQEAHPGLKTACRKLGKIVQNTGDFHAAQGTAEATVLGDPLAYHSADAFIVKETLTNRHILLRELLQAQTATRQKLQATDRLKSSTSVRRDKVDEAISALDEARSHEAYLAHKTERVTACLVAERRAWFARTAAALRLSLREYVLREIEAERRTLAMLEAARPDIRAIDPSGGLSRLGREAHPAARRASLMSSQGPKGDAWSGVARRQDGLNRSISGSFMAPGLPEEEEEEDEEEEEEEDGQGEGEDEDGKRGGGVNGDRAGGALTAAAKAKAKGKARQRSISGAGSMGSVKEEEDDEDKVDARNAASRLAASTF